jgi:short-subunit dehydrogenase
MLVRGATVLVTGASSGLGRAVAELLAAKGANVILHGRDESALRTLADRIGGAAIAVDLAEPDAARRLAAKAVECAGRVDVLVANAGAGWAGRFSTMDRSRGRELIAVNLMAPIELTGELLPAMLERRSGHLVYVTSIAGRMGVADEAVYSATKAGLDTFAESLRLELRHSGVGVGTFVPGVIATDFFVRRGRPYVRKRPRPLPAELAAAALVRLVETGAAEAYLPRWLRLPVLIRHTTPDVYRRLATRFGRS